MLQIGDLREKRERKKWETVGSRKIREREGLIWDFGLGLGVCGGREGQIEVRDDKDEWR
jgi:hypothetical protein